MKRIALLFTAAVAAFSAQAQIAITTSSLTYTQDFNTLDTGGTARTTLPAGWAIFEYGGSGTPNGTYRASNGSSNAGDSYSFGTNLSTERALGSIGSGAVANINYGAAFVNNTGAALDSMTISFRQELWRRGGGTTNDTVRFFWTTSATASLLDSTFAGWNEVPSLMMNSISTSTVGAAVNGNDTFRVHSAKVPVNVPAGGRLVIRWHDFNSFGSDDGNSIDSLTVAFKTGTGGGVGIQTISTRGSLPLQSINPASNGQFNLSCSLQQAGSLTARVYDMSGRELATQQFAGVKGDNRIQLQASVPAGNYTIVVDNGKEWGSVKVSMQ
jgi:hypothetical protein